MWFASWCVLSHPNCVTAAQMARVSDAVVGAVGGMKVEYSGEPVVVQLSIG